MGLSWLRHLVFHDNRDISIGDAASPPKRLPDILRTKEQNEARLSLRAWSLSQMQGSNGKKKDAAHASAADGDGLYDRVAFVLDRWEPGTNCHNREDYVLELAGHLNRKLDLQVSVWSYRFQAAEAADILLDNIIAISVEMEPLGNAEGRQSQGDLAAPLPGEQLLASRQCRVPSISAFRQRGYFCNSYAENGRPGSRGLHTFSFPGASHRPR